MSSRLCDHVGSGNAGLGLATPGNRARSAMDAMLRDACKQLPNFDHLRRANCYKIATAPSKSEG
jgi:hypothetical protein